MKRTTQVELVNAVRTLNRELGYPADGGTAIGYHCPGAFCLAGAYGGWQLQRCEERGVVSVTTGYRSKRELRELVNAMVFGIRVLKGEGATI
jgi:hypothetical protein